ncbi:hypothetical protein DFH07DRAFT_972378 [Mycena maculata]|uniref:Uncharacterized protein n=1 Tax=Mycena maculata TaxID=230809 RepID=A0AAD7HI07_9AGAR|nr:hypothetical protein DFH07DRAFT_972378 [Mycena maculata]
MPTRGSAESRTCSAVQLRAMHAYRDRNADNLRAKARERMARRRQRAKDTGELGECQARACAASRHFRERNGAQLAEVQRACRAYKFIEKHGLAAYEARNATPPPEAPSPEETETSSSAVSVTGEYDAEMLDFLDNHDPTTHPDYIPKPGEQRFFQRGKWRWY